MFPTLLVAADSVESSANAPATITYASAGDLKHKLEGWVLFGYDGDPAATGFLTITRQGIAPIKIPVSKGGAGFIPISIKTENEESLEISLSAGGSGIKGYVTAIGKGFE